MTETDGSALDRAVRVMDRLRSPGGCPWDAEQTHRTLARYLVEECYEVLEAIETDDPTLLREELGDLLLQVLFHARLAQELPADDAFGIDEVAADLADKLVRRHPHVFGPDRGSLTADELDSVWEAQKIREKGRTSAVDGVPLAQPALALAAKLYARAQRAGLDPAVGRSGADPSNLAPGAGDSERGDFGSGDETAIGLRLFAVVRDAVGAGIDPEGALRRVAGDYRKAIVNAESDTPLSQT